MLGTLGTCPRASKPEHDTWVEVRDRRGPSPRPSPRAQGRGKGSVCHRTRREHSPLSSRSANARRAGTQRGKRSSRGPWVPDTRYARSGMTGERCVPPARGRASANLWEICQSACKPGSVWRLAPPRRPFIWDVDHSTPRATNPGGGVDHARAAQVAPHRTCRPYSVLLPVGFAVPLAVAGSAVRSYRTVSPLPARTQAVCFLWHCPWGRPRRPLAATADPGARTFLHRMLGPQSPLLRQRPPGRLAA